MHLHRCHPGFCSLEVHCCETQGCNTVASAVWSVRMTVKKDEFNEDRDAFVEARRVIITKVDPITHEEYKVFFVSLVVRRHLWLCAKCGFGKHDAKIFTSVK